MTFHNYTVALGLLNGNGKLYLSRRIQTDTFPGKWQFPGGKLDENENPIDGAIRETKEETGLDIGINRLRYIGPITGDPTTKTCYVYYVILNDSEIPKRMENDKHTDWELMDYNNALKLDLMPGLEIIIKKLKTENL